MGHINKTMQVSKSCMYVVCIYIQSHFLFIHIQLASFHDCITQIEVTNSCSLHHQMHLSPDSSSTWKMQQIFVFPFPFLYSDPSISTCLFIHCYVHFLYNMYNAYVFIITGFSWPKALNICRYIFHYTICVSCQGLR